ncbi:DUF6484 domain-containing protein [Massilia sp. P8910]|uniref:DUF6484 domain-containing protein n=1 Tax=Massilia antarctica TaxID=2765360 RepID=UPI001E543D6D|nr:DUF6484 domain-containing protein [Massilia antarctica]MCE3603003.1 DUF6484 domain-containing protein [Massilia antarctica]
MQHPEHAPLGAAPADAFTPTTPDQLLHDVVAHTPALPARADGIAIGVFDSLDEQGSVFVNIAAFGLSRVAARSLCPLHAAQIGQALALGFEAGDPRKPIVLGVMLAGSVHTLPQVDVVVDGERIVLQADHEIELRCGEAAIVLSADGRIQLRGTYITSHASATQRILGGSVNIN